MIILTLWTICGIFFIINAFKDDEDEYLYIDGYED